MSACISGEGEYGEHVLDAEYLCTRCGWLDEDELRAELRMWRNSAPAGDLPLHPQLFDGSCLFHGSGCVRGYLLRMDMAVDPPKMLREALCVGQALLANMATADPGIRDARVASIGRLITEIDRHRPLGPNGKHGNRHTATCGCEVPGDE